MTCSCKEVLLQRKWLRSLTADIPVLREGWDGYRDNFELQSNTSKKNLTSNSNTPKINGELRWNRTPLRWQQVVGQTEGEVAVKQDQDTSHRLKGNHHRIKKKPYVAHTQNNFLLIVMVTLIVVCIKDIPWFFSFFNICFFQCGVDYHASSKPLTNPFHPNPPFFGHNDSQKHCF